MQNKRSGAVIGLALALAIAPLAVRARIDFGTMPVGCSWTTTYSIGEVVTKTVLGKSKGKFKTRVTAAANPGEVNRHSLHNRNGRLVRKD